MRVWSLGNSKLRFLSKVGEKEANRSQRYKSTSQRAEGAEGSMDFLKHWPDHSLFSSFIYWLKKYLLYTIELDRLCRCLVYMFVEWVDKKMICEKNSWMAPTCSCPRLPDWSFWDECGSHAPAYWFFQLPFLPGYLLDWTSFLFYLTPTSSPHRPLACQSWHSHYKSILTVLYPVGNIGVNFN